MNSEHCVRPQPQRSLEGAGSEARLLNLQRRFARLNQRLDEPRAWRPWRLAILCALTFAGEVAAGLLLTR
jgi:hypothetical protein